MTVFCMLFSSIVSSLADTTLPVGTILLEPIPFSGGRLWMLLPITLSVAVVYKATKVSKLSQLPVAALLLWVTILLGMIAVGFVLRAIEIFF